jgi:hypothetical protein
MRISTYTGTTHNTQADGREKDGGSVEWRVSTEVNVVPDTFPFAACPDSVCNNPPHTKKLRLQH